VDSELPFIDEHRVLVSAPPAAVWSALATRMPRLGSLAHVLGAEPRHASGKPLEEGATMPGFKVESVEPGHRVVLTGRHRLSRYEFVFTLDAEPGGTMLSARSNAEFPGPQGWIYRKLVIGSGIHGLLVPRLLNGIGHRAAKEIS
jgi:hypothetical protein